MNLQPHSVAKPHSNVMESFPPLQNLRLHVILFSSGIINPLYCAARSRLNKHHLRAQMQAHTYLLLSITEPLQTLGTQ